MKKLLVLLAVLTLLFSGFVFAATAPKADAKAAPKTDTKAAPKTDAKGADKKAADEYSGKPVQNLGPVSKAYAAYNKGYDFYLVKDYKNAVRQLLVTIKNKPDFSKSYNLMGLSYMGVNKSDEAIKYYKIALYTDINYAEAAYNMAVAYESKDKIDLAEQFYLKAIALNNDSHVFVRASLNLANIYRNQTKYDDAITLLRKAQVYEPDFAELYNSAGLSYLAAGDETKDTDTKLYDLAISNFKTATEKDQKYVEAQNNLAIVYERQGNLARALGQLEEALKMNSEHPGANYNYGKTLIENGNYDRAIAFLQKAIKLDPNFAEAHYALGKGFWHKNMFNEAGSEFKKAIKIKKGDYDIAKLALADLNKQKKDFTSHIVPTPVKVEGEDSGPVVEEKIDDAESEAARVKEEWEIEDPTPEKTDLKF
ncbi:MAG: tetratricopeptide repeat protein [bacterium]